MKEIVTICLEMSAGETGRLQTIAAQKDLWKFDKWNGIYAALQESASSSKHFTALVTHPSECIRKRPSTALPVHQAHMFQQLPPLPTLL